MNMNVSKNEMEDPMRGVQVDMLVWIFRTLNFFKAGIINAGEAMMQFINRAIILKELSYQLNSGIFDTQTATMQAL